jgi:hypothetical protein
VLPEFWGEMANTEERFPKLEKQFALPLTREETVTIGSSLSYHKQERNGITYLESSSASLPYQLKQLDNTVRVQRLKEQLTSAQEELAKKI